MIWVSIGASSLGSSEREAGSGGPAAPDHQKVRIEALWWQTYAVAISGRSSTSDGGNVMGLRQGR